MPEISIIIVSWNARDYLGQCLRSIAASRTEGAPEAEIIVVDNDSADGSAELVEREFPQVRLIRSGGNLGFARGNNLGMRAARGNFFYLINSDVELHSGCLEELHRFMLAHPQCGIAGPRILNRDGSLQSSCRRLPTLANILYRALYLDNFFPGVRRFSIAQHDPRRPDEVLDAEILTGCFWVLRRTAVDEVGMLDERYFMYSEDVDWCKRFHDSRWRTLYNPAARAIHYGGGSSGNAPLRFYLEMQKSKLQYWRKHFAPPKVGAYVLLMLLHHALRAVPFGVMCLLRPRNQSLQLKFKRYSAAFFDLLNFKKHFFTVRGGN